MYVAAQQSNFGNANRTKVNLVPVRAIAQPASIQRQHPVVEILDSVAYTTIAPHCLYNQTAFIKVQH